MKRHRLAMFALLFFLWLPGGLAAGGTARDRKLPVKIVVVVPRDYPAYLDFQQALSEVDRWASMTQEWLLRETGLTFDYDLTLHYSRWSLAELNTPATLDACAGRAPTPEGQGLNLDLFQNRVLYQELGWRVYWPGHERLWAVVIGAGGWAGGAYSGDENDFGFLVVGDWMLHQALLYEVDPCNLYYGWDIEPGHAVGHEVLHSMGADPHNPVVFLGDPLTDQQRSDLKRHNRFFLRTPSPPDAGLPAKRLDPDTDGDGATK